MDDADEVAKSPKHVGRNIIMIVTDSFCLIKSKYLVFVS